MVRVLILALSVLGLQAIVAAPSYAAVDAFEGVCSQHVSDNTQTNAICRDAENARTEANNPLFGKDGILTKVFNILSIVAGIAAVIVIIVNGLKFVTSGSNPQDANNAREGIIYAVIGLVIAIIAQAIVQLFLNNV